MVSREDPRSDREAVSIIFSIVAVAKYVASIFVIFKTPYKIEIGPSKNILHLY